MSLSSLATILNRGQTADAWLAEQEHRGVKVAMFRDYADGDHPANMTPEMRKLLRVSRPVEAGSEFADNYMDIVIQTMADRISLNTVEADNKSATDWIVEVLRINRMDALQGDVTEGAIRDADTFLMVSFDEKTGLPRFTHELAYDGVSGMLVMYKSNDSAEMECAIKIWRVQTANGTLITIDRMNIYYPDHIQKWISTDNGVWSPYLDDPTAPSGRAAWIDRNGQPLGIPVFHFKNRGRQNYGLSEIDNAIPLQDALNRVLHSIVMTSELTAFQIRWAKGFKPPSGITPGAWVEISPSAPLAPDQIVDIGVLSGGDMSNQLATAQWLVNEIGRITRTPAPELGAGDNASGESLKQREIGLLGKVRRFMVKAGNTWEDVIAMAFKVQEAFSANRPPAYKSLSTQWEEPEIRNDMQLVEIATMIADRIGEREFLRMIAPIRGWDEAKIDEIMAQKQSELDSRVSSLGAAIPGFGNFDNSFGAKNPQQQLLLQGVA